MRIAKVDVFPIRIPKSADTDDKPLYSSTSWDRCVYSRCQETLFVRIETDEGVAGWGEALAPIAPEVPAMIIEKLLSTVLIGKNPLDNEVLYTRMYNSMKGRKTNSGFMLDAIAACDIALWDLKGKLLNAPVWQLLGGKYRERVPVYVSGVVKGGFASSLEAAKDYMQRGFKAFKGVPLDLSFRDGLGPEAVLMYDGLWRYSFDQAIAVGKMLKEMNAAFFECPLAPEAIDDHRRLRELTGVPIGLGEAERTRYEFLELFQKDAVDFVQADIGRTGITEFRAIADLARVHNRLVAPHESAGMGICIAASIHMSAAIPNLYMLEYKQLTTEAANELLRTPLLCEKGSFAIPQGSGLGIELDEEKLMRYRVM
ncbi:MAG: enolase [Paenibacillus sp.]|jgi:galactonate dehydratase|nr:enolase [Paenibacillus sp.]